MTTITPNITKVTLPKKQKRSAAVITAAAFNLMLMSTSMPGKCLASVLHGINATAAENISRAKLIKEPQQRASQALAAITDTKQLKENRTLVLQALAEAATASSRISSFHHAMQHGQKLADKPDSNIDEVTKQAIGYGQTSANNFSNSQQKLHTELRQAAVKIFGAHSSSTQETKGTKNSTTDGQINNAHRQAEAYIAEATSASDPAVAVHRTLDAIDHLHAADEHINRLFHVEKDVENHEPLSETQTKLFRQVERLAETIPENHKQN